jgi:hypothetical protein
MALWALLHLIQGCGSLPVLARNTLGHYRYHITRLGSLLVG